MRQQKPTWWEILLMPIAGPIVFGVMLFVIGLSRSVTKQADINEQRRREHAVNH